MTMRFNVAQLLKEGVGARRSYQLEGQSGVIDGLNRQRPVVGQVGMLRTPNGILVRSQMTVTIQIVCSRCLETFDQELALEMDEEFFPTTDVNTGAAFPPPSDVAAFTIDDRHILDLTEAVRQYTLLAEPMKPICRPDCLGLCPTCGGNRNLGQCRCPAEALDPRWAALLDLPRRTKAN